jgi:hypothetical protein
MLTKMALVNIDWRAIDIFFWSDKIKLTTE